MENVLYFLPEIIIGLGICVLLIIGALIQFGSELRTEYATIYVFHGSIFVVLLSFISIYYVPYSKLFIYDSLFMIDLVTQGFKGMVLLFSFFIIIFSKVSLKNQFLFVYEYYILVLSIILGSLLLISSSDFMSLYLTLELSSISTYILVSFKNKIAESIESGLKYFILGTFSSMLLLYGFSLIYALKGITKLYDYALFINSLEDIILLPNIILIGILFIFSAFLFKLSVAPFHIWVPDLYEGLPYTTINFIGIVPKLSIFAVFIRFFTNGFFNASMLWSNLIIIAGLMSIVIGFIGAFTQSKLRRFLGFSTIVHMGYIVITIGLNTFEGLQSSIMYLIVYALMSMNLFFILIMIQNKGYNTNTITSLKGFIRFLPFESILLSINLFAMTGVPPFIGFYSKYYVFLALMHSEKYSLTAIIMLLSVCSAFYYLRIIEKIFFSKEDISKSHFLNKNNTNLSPISYIITTITTFIILIFCINPSTLLLFSANLATALI